MKLIHTILLTVLAIIFTFQSQAQRAKDGNYTVSTAGDVVNTYTSLTANASIGNTSITVSNSAMGGAHFSSNLAAGDLIMIYQAYGADVDVNIYTAMPSPGWNQNYTVPDSYFASNYEFYYEFGRIYNYKDAGKFEQIEVSSVAGANTINLQCGLKNNYDFNKKVQIIRIPRFNNLTVNSASSIVPVPWNGTTGGIVALEVNTAMTVNSGGLIHANGLGFRGGQLDPTPSLTGNTTAAFELRLLGAKISTEGSEKGESIFGYQTELAAIYSRWGIGAVANGGGGGGYQNAGGGGGSNVSSTTTGYYGNGTPDPTYNTAWALDITGPPYLSSGQGTTNISGTSTPGGGRGGYALAQTDQNELAVGPNNTSWGGDSRKSNGGRGGHPLAYDATRLFFGGGGGAGDQDGGQGGAGGNGGGIVYIKCYGTITGSGNIEANGGAGQGTNPLNQNTGTSSANLRKGNDGAGGGGAGGAIFIENAVAIPATITLNARGGNGGNQNIRLHYNPPIYNTTDEAGGPGGSGTGGSIAFTSGAPTQNVTAGTNGIVISERGTSGSGYTPTPTPIVGNFPPNGATNGSVGMSGLTAPYYDLTISDVTICGGSVNLAVTVLGTLPAGGIIRWYDQPFGGTILHSGSTYTVSPAVTTTYYIGVCPNSGTFRVPVTVTVVSSPNLTITNPAPVCSGTVDITLPAVTAGSDAGTLTYWTNAGATIPYGTPTAATNGTYYIQLDIGGGCTSIQPVTVTVNTAPNLVITNPAAVCSGTVDLTAPAVTAGSDAGTLSYWTNVGATISYGTPAAATNGTYYIQLTSGGCSTVQAVTATVNAGPNLIITNPPAVCSPGTVNLTAPAVTAGSDAGTLSYWTNAGATIPYGTPTTATNGTYYIQLTSGSCSTVQAVTATVTSSPNLVVTSPAAVCSPSTVDLTAPAVTAGSDVGTLTYWTNPGATIPYGTPSAATNGTYYIQLDLGGGCLAVQSVIATVNTTPNLIVTNPAAVCNPNTVDLTSPSVTAGSDAGTLSYWTNVGATTSYGTPGTATNGTYYIQLTSGSCSTVQPVTVTVNPGPNLIVTNPSAVCAPGTVNLTAPSVTAGSDAGTLSYWTNIGATIAYGTPTMATNGTYYIQLTSGGCSTVQSVTATINALPNLIITDPAPVCAPLTIDLTVPAVTAGSDAGTLTYWTNVGATTSYGTPAAATNGTYYIQLTDGNTCSVVQAVNAVVNPMPAVNISNTGPVCLGGSFNLNETGGAANSWTWSSNGSATITTNTSQSPSVTGAVDGEVFTVVITDANSCTNSGNTTISVTQAPVLDPIANVVNCGPYTLPAIQGTNLTGSEAYYDNSVLSGGNQITGPITANQTVWVYDGIATCEDEISFQVTINPLPTVTSFTGGGNYCDSDVPLDVVVAVTGASDWTLDYTLNGAAQTINSSTSPISLGNAAGTYILTNLTDMNCSNTVSQTQTILITATPVEPVASGDAIYCVGDPMLDMTVSGNGGTYTWYSDNGLSSVYGTGASITPSSQTMTYYVTESLNGCESTADNVTITIDNCDITYPTAFTPDGDGSNDNWEILGLDDKYPDNVVRIYNRWGNLIFEHKSSITNPYNNNRWDGTYKGSPLPVGSFYYIIDLNGKSEQATGTVSIILN